MTAHKKAAESPGGDVTKAIIYTSAIVMAIGCGLLIAALIIPPPGEIDHSVLVAFGEISTFSGTLMGIKKNVECRM